MSRLHILQHLPVGFFDFLFREQTGQDSNGGSTVIIDLILIETGRERRAVEIDMRNELAVLFVPQMGADILLQLVAHLCPLLTFGRIVLQLQIIIQSQDHHGIVIDIDSKMGVLVDFDAPRMFGLHIAPVGRRCAD